MFFSFCLFLPHLADQIRNGGVRDAGGAGSGGGVISAATLHSLLQSLVSFHFIFDDFSPASDKMEVLKPELRGAQKQQKKKNKAAVGAAAVDLGWSAVRNVRNRCGIVDPDGRMSEELQGFQHGTAA